MKKIYMLLLLSFGFGNIWSQTFSWAKNEGLWAYDYGLGIGTDNSGNVYCSGKYEMNAIFSGTTLSCAGNHDIFLAKYNSSGALSWIRTGGGAQGDYAECLATDGTNNVYIAGEIEGYGNLISFPGSTITLNCIGDNDIFLAKYDLAGNLLWAKTAGGYNNEKALGISCDNSGNVFICGHYSDSCVFGGVVTLYGSGVKDMYVAKYDMNGNFLWARNAGSPGRDEAKGLKCDAAGNVYVAGFHSNNILFGSTTYSTVSGVYYDAFLAKYSPTGTLLWVKMGGGNFDEVAWGVTVDNVGLIYVTGEFNASAYFGATQLITSGNADIFVVCYDANGNEQWVKKAGGPLIDRARGIGTDGSNIFITGQFGATASFGSNSVSAADSSDVFFASLNNSGTFLSAVSVGGAADAFEPLGYESGTAICAETSGNVYATGGLLDGGTFGSISVSPYSRTDAFVTKITQMVNVNTISNSGTKTIHVYPNPATGNFTIDLDQLANQTVDVSVYNCLGQVVAKKTNKSSSNINFDLTAIENGLYFIEIKSDDKLLTIKKIVIQK